MSWALSRETRICLLSRFSLFDKVILLRTDSFVIRNPALDEEEVLASSIKQYYVSGAFVPKEVLLSRPIDQPELIQTWLSELRGNKVTIRAPMRGHGARLVDLALKNAENELTKEKHKDSTERALERIAAKFHLPVAPVSIEGYDISNISGSEPVGVKILFKGGQPDKSAYRQYKIRGFQNQDDPGMIYQTISRRVGHMDEEPLPDLFLIDGGKSQLNAACAALKDTARQQDPGGCRNCQSSRRRHPRKILLARQKESRAVS